MTIIVIKNVWNDLLLVSESGELVRTVHYVSLE